MTSSTGRRSDSAPQSNLDDRDIDALKRRQLRLEQIMDSALPTTDELLTGLPPRNDDIQSDTMAYIDGWRERRPSDQLLESDLFIASELARQTADHQNLSALLTAARRSGERCHEDQLLARRAEVLLALMGDVDAAGRSVFRAIRTRSGRPFDIAALHAIAFAIGVSTAAGGGDYEAGDAAKNLKFGFRVLSELAPMVPEVADQQDQGGLAGLLKRQRAAQDDDDEDRAVGALEAMLESGAFENEDDVTLNGEGIVVVPKMPEGIGGQKETRKSWKGMAGAALPVVHRGEVAGHRAALVARYPYAFDVIDVMLRDLAPREGAWFRPTLLVGPPGSGKTSLLRAIADQVGLPCELNSVAGSTDSSAMGTSAQWSTVRESVPLQLIKRSKMASVCMIWDELDKASSSRNNGSVIDALLPLLESDQARRYRDLALEVEVDLSGVSHFATANSLEAVPAPLRDRFRILTMPEPTWTHLGTLTRQIVDRIASERGIHPGFFEPLGQDEMDNVRKNWPGGSIRQLTQILTTIIDRRDAIMARC
jgi:hypothetical protein